MDERDKNLVINIDYIKAEQEKISSQADILKYFDLKKTQSLQEKKSEYLLKSNPPKEVLEIQRI